MRSSTSVAVGDAQDRDRGHGRRGPDLATEFDPTLDRDRLDGRLGILAALAAFGRLGGVVSGPDIDDRELVLDEPGEGFVRLGRLGDGVAG